MDNSSNGRGGISWVNVISLAGAFCAFCIGSGFASGQEVMQFFTAHGLFSFGALFICLVLFMWLGSSLMAAGQRLKLETTTDIFAYYCGPILGKVFEYFVPFFLFCVVVIMFAGAGATINEYFGLSADVGRIIMALLSLLTVIMGLGKLVKIIGSIGPVIIALSIIVGIIGIFSSPDGVVKSAEMMTQLEVPKAAGNWVVSGGLYAAFMIFGSAPFFAGMGSEAKGHKEALWGGLLGGLFLIGAAAIMSTGLLANIAAVYDKQVPNLAVAGASSHALALFFSVVLFAGIYTTAAPMLWSVCNRLALDGTKKFKILAVILTVIAYFGAQLPFGKLVGTIYPYTGYLGLVFIACLLYRQFRPRKA
ncbi:MAG: hypothetical protein LBV79_06830 [Candidatus Adiutrix sp.]|jgi:uncharacterized membrane protein YkvI|nr:hypothetical protein [Candidatus Adiutrix sp.]